MKKIFTMICVAAAALVGCQNVDDMNEGALGGKNFKATASTPELTRTELVYAEGAYKAQWCEGDQVALIEIVTSGEESEVAKYESNALTAAAESAVFGFEVPAVAAESYQYVLVYPYGNVGNANATTANLTLATSQVKKDASFGANCDLLIAKSEVFAAQPESVAFTLTRLSAVAKMTLKNFVIPAGEVVKNVTLSCEQPLTGTIGVNYADLLWSVVDGVNSVTTTNYEWTVATDGTLDVYFSVLPATLAAGESYTITVETDKATYHKVANFASDLKFVAGDITIFSANMNGAASKTKLEKLNENCEYAIGYTDASGNVYLLPRNAATRRVSAHKVGTSGTGFNGESYDLTSVSIDAKGTLVGDIATTYRWEYTKTQEGNIQFHYTTGSGNEAYLIGCDQAQGIAIMSKNTEGIYAGHYKDSQTYYDYFIPSSVEGGYWMQVPETNRYLCYNSATDQFRALGSSDVVGVLNFYRIQPAPTRTLYPVITDAAHVTEGTYVIMHNIDGVYKALKNDNKAESATAVVAEDVSLTMENGVVTAAEVGDAYKWVVTESNKADGYFQIRSWEQPTLWAWHRNNAKGFAVCDTETATGNHTSHWQFVNVAEWGMQMNGLDDETSAHVRYARVNGDVWGTLGSPTGSIVLVKLSNSTEVKPQNE